MPRNSPRFVFRRWAAALLLCCLIAGSQAAAQVKAVPSLQRVRDLIAAHKLQQAETLLWQLVRTDPDNADPIALMGLIRSEQGRDDEAEALLRRAVALNPASATAQFELGELLSKRGKAADAIAAYQKAHAAAPNEAKVSARLAAALEASGDYAGSLAAAESIAPAQQPATLLPVIGSDYLALHQTEKLTPLVGRVMADAPKHPALGPAFAKMLLQYGLVADAQELLKRLPPAQKTSTDFLIMWARAEEMNGHRAEARRTLAAAAQRDPKSYEAWFQSARLAAADSDWPKEAAFLQHALQISPDQPECLRQMVAVQMRLHQSTLAVKTARRLTELQPDNLDAMYLMAAAATDAEQWQVARPLLEKLLTKRDTVPDRVALGMVLFKQGEFDAAGEQIDRALQENPKESEAHYYRGLLARQKGDSAQAISEFETVLSEVPDHPFALAALGKLYLQAGQAERARVALEKAVKLAPAAGDNHYQLALAYARLGMADRAKAEMNEYNNLRKAVDEAKRASRSSEQ